VLNTFLPCSFSFSVVMHGKGYRQLVGFFSLEARGHSDSGDRSLGLHARSWFANVFFVPTRSIVQVKSKTHIPPPLANREGPRLYTPIMAKI
jgi:hypothetical protein